ncbi:uncharacterized protein LOC110381136 isoform X2 [Helicoverpa armigera]|uniref:uncharacterized protein LOC110381136 isoform X2 n=1 Tax=Helicoverpa armigera TaxID=29058 RepID=UPI0030836B18
MPIRNTIVYKSNAQASSDERKSTKMKELLAVISLLVSGAVAEPPAPYAPSGWRPDGPAFVLPQRGQEQPSQYLPPAGLPLDPRNPNPNVEYGTPQEEDVSVQGLPPQREEVPFFQRSPVNGRQNVGQAFNSDLQNLDQGLRQTQYQEQQQRYREFERQRQRDAQLAANRLPEPQIPAQFAPRTTSTTEAPTTEATTPVTTTEVNLNEGETLDDDEKDAKVSVEKQKIQEYPGELFLSSLAQLQLQPQFVPLQQFGQLRSPLYLQPVQSQKQVAGFDAQTHFAALPSIIAQQQLQQQKVEQGFQSPALLVAPQPQPQIQPVTAYQQPQFQAEPIAVQPAQAVQPQGFYGQSNAEAVPQYQTVNAFPQQQLQPVPQFTAQPVVLQPQGVNQLQPAQFQPQPQEVDQYQPQTVQFQPQPQQPNQYQPQTVQFQPQPAQFQPQPAQFQPQPPQFQPQPAQFQPQPAPFQPQPGQYQPQPSQYQPQADQESRDVESNDQPQLYQQPFVVPANQYQAQFQPQPGYIQAQLINYPGQDLAQLQQQQQQAQLFMQQAQFEQQTQFQNKGQSPDALQSGLDVNQQGNDLDEPQDQEDSQDEGRTATAVATAFGARTQPRVQPLYGSPYPVPRVQAAPGSITTTESTVEDVTDDGPVVAQAVAIADGNRKKSAKLRSRRVRPVFTLDRSGHLVLAQGQ